MSLPDIEKTILPWVGKTSKMMSICLKEKLRQHGINLTREQWILLKKLNDGDGQAQNDLAIITERNKASLTRLINTMERKNYVARIPDTKDKRINRIFLTKNGKNVLESTYPAMTELMLELQTGISEEEKAVVIRVMKKVMTNINESINCS